MKMTEHTLKKDGVVVEVFRLTEEQNKSFAIPLWLRTMGTLPAGVTLDSKEVII